MEKNIIGVEVTKPCQGLVIMRGLPGSGKSTKARELVNDGVIHSTDDVVEARCNYAEHFRKMDEGNDWTPHGKMHRINFINACESMRVGITPVVVDNTNVKMSDARTYVEAALEMGFHEDNIQIVDVGTGGRTLEELTARNAHNVPFEVVQAMHNTWEASGEITVKRIIDTKGERKPKVLYSAVVLDDKSREKLLKAMGHHIPEGWETIAHHMTIVFGKGFPEEIKNFLEASCKLRVTAIGKSDMAVAVKVEGFYSANAIPHITLAVNREEGGKPVMSNAITEWVELENYINLTGIGKEITV